MDRDNEVVDGADGDLPDGKVPLARAAAARAQEDRDQRVNRANEGSLNAPVPLAPCPRRALQFQEHLRGRVRHDDGSGRILRVWRQRAVVVHRPSISLVPAAPW